MNRAEVSKLPLWEIIYFGDWSSAIVVFWQRASIWSKWSPYEVGVSSPAAPVYC